MKHLAALRARAEQILQTVEAVNWILPPSNGPDFNRDCAQVVRDLLDVVARQERIVELERRAYDRLALCPDHRDKSNGTCIVCQAEIRTKGEAGRPS